MAGTVPPTVPSLVDVVTWVRMTFEVVIGAIEASPVYSRIESTVTVTVTSPDRSAVSLRVAGSRIAALPAAFAPATSVPIARLSEPLQRTDIG